MTLRLVRISLQCKSGLPVDAIGRQAVGQSRSLAVQSAAAALAFSASGKLRRNTTPFPAAGLPMASVPP